MDHKIFGEQLVVYADGMYQDVKTHNELAPPATGNFQSPGFTTLAIPPRVSKPAGTAPVRRPTYAATGLTPGAFNPFNPFNQIISGGTRARLAEFGNRLFDNESEAWLGTIGFRGDKLFNGTWGYDSAFRYSEIKNTTTGQQVSISRFNRILNQADPIFNPTSPEYIGTRVAFNPFVDFHRSWWTKILRHLRRDEHSDLQREKRRDRISRLDINAAGRYEAFLNNDTSVAVPKIGVRWQPVDDTLTIRFTWGLGFREPSLEELYSAPISDIKQSLVPMNGGALVPETPILIRRSRDLRPED